jgi:hypothetical protein
MQRLTRHILQKLIGGLPYAGTEERNPRPIPSISFIPDERMPDMRQMNPYLMGATSLQLTFYPAGQGKPLEYPPVRNRMLPLATVGKSPIFLALMRITGDVRRDGPPLHRWLPPHQCPVPPLSGMGKKLLG